MAIGTLQFQARRRADVPEEVEGGVTLRGEIEWFVKGSTMDIDALVAAVGEGFAERAAEGMALLKFRNAVGRFRVGELGTLSVRCGKWDEDTFDSMLEDLTRVSLALPFSALERAGLPHDRSIADRDDVFLHAFLYARHIVLTGDPAFALGPALESITRDPHRRFFADRERGPLSEVRRADARTLSQIAIGAEPLTRARGALERSELARTLHGRVPETADSPRARHDVNTIENRFTKAFLAQLTALIDRVERVAASRHATSTWRRIASDCEEMRRRLTSHLRHDLWLDVGPMQGVPMASAAMQRRRGYKDVLRHHLALRASARLPFNDARVAESLLGMKDVASLYELWCFFAVVRSVGVVLGSEPTFAERLQTDDAQVDVRWGMRVAWGDFVDVIYNPSFSRASTRPERRSSSLQLRPDIVVHRRTGRDPGMHVFDAKLRVEGLSRLADLEDVSDDGNALSFKREDVAKMHAYRDALEHVRSAFVLYPGDEVVTFRSPEGASDVDAVGAIPLVPGGHPQALNERVRRILLT